MLSDRSGAPADRRRRKPRATGATLSYLGVSMRTRPEGLGEADMVRALSRAWNLRADRLHYMPEGGGSHHWRMVDEQRMAHFVTVDDLDRKRWLGECRDTVFEGLRRAFDTAVALRSEGHLDFVVAPLPATGGESVVRLSPRYSIALFPFLDAAPARFGRHRDSAERLTLVRVLAQLHRATDLVTVAAPRHRLQLANRDRLDSSLRDLDTVWDEGPLSEAARELLAANAATAARLLDVFDDLAFEVTAHGVEMVVTHGEPHTGNLMDVAGKPALVDWDTLALAPPERDLWMVTDDARELARYTDETGRDIDTEALALYRLRWILDDIASFTDVLRSPHALTNDTAHALRNLEASLEIARVHDARRPRSTAPGRRSTR